MGTPQDMQNQHVILKNGDQVQIYRPKDKGQGYLYLQLRREVTTERDILASSFKVAVELTPTDAIKIATHLLSFASPLLTTQQSSDTDEFSAI